MSYETCGGPEDREAYIKSILSRVNRDVMLKNHVYSINEGRCWNIKARCHFSKKRMFGRLCVKIVAKKIALDQFVIEETFYFTPKHYLVWSLKR